METTTNQDLDKVLSKLRKLKALYEGAKKINSEGEANAAAAAIQRLLTQYNLSMDEVSKEEKKEDETVQHEFTSGYTFKSIGGEWEFRLAYVICKWNFCRCFVYGRSYKKLLIVGKKENLETVQWLRNMLADRFVAISKVRFKEYKQTPEYAARPISLDKYQRSYLMGCAAGLDAKFKEESDKAKKEDEEFGVKVNALVLRNDTAVQKYVAEQFGKAGHRASREKFDGARQSGYTDGKNTTFDKQITSSTRAQADGVKLLK